MFIDDNLLSKIDKLSRLYEYKWGKPVENIKWYMPPEITQEKMIETLKLMCDTGDSVLVAYNKLYNTNSKEYRKHNKNGKTEYK